MKSKIEKKKSVKPRAGSLQRSINQQTSRHDQEKETSDKLPISEMEMERSL